MPYHKLLLRVITTMPTMGIINGIIALRKENKSSEPKEGKRGV